MYLYKIEISICPTPPYNKALIYKEKYIKVVIVGKTHNNRKTWSQRKNDFPKGVLREPRLKGFYLFKMHETSF